MIPKDTTTSNFYVELSRDGCHYVYEVSYVDLLLAFLKCKHKQTVDTMEKQIGTQATAYKEIRHKLTEANADINAYPKPIINTLYDPLRRALDVTGVLLFILRNFQCLGVCSLLLSILSLLSHYETQNASKFY